MDFLIEYRARRRQQEESIRQSALEIWRLRSTFLGYRRNKKGVVEAHWTIPYYTGKIVMTREELMGHIKMCHGIVDTSYSRLLLQYWPRGK